MSPASWSCGRAGAHKFNGTVVVEWLNVSASTADASADWNAAHREIMRSGYAYVGVGAEGRRRRRSQHGRGERRARPSR